MIAINYWAVLIATIVSCVIGSLWYGPLFGNTWMKLTGVSPKAMKAMQKKAKFSMIFQIIATLIMSAVLSLFVSALEIVGWPEGIGLGFWLWLGFLAPVLLGSILWEGKPVKLYILNAAYWLVNLCVMGAIIGLWK